MGHWSRWDFPGYSWRQRLYHWASAQATEKSLGGLIMRGFGSGAEPGATARGGNESEVLAFTGDSSRVGRTLAIVVFEAMIMVMGFVELLV